MPLYSLCFFVCLFVWCAVFLSSELSTEKGTLGISEFFQNKRVFFIDASHYFAQASQREREHAKKVTQRKTQASSPAKDKEPLTDETVELYDGDSNPHIHLVLQSISILRKARTRAPYISSQ